MIKIGFISLGCAKNLVDSEYIIGMFARDTFVLCDEPAECDVIIINTCGFILKAKEEAIATILEMAAYKQAKLKKLIVTGCFAQRYYQELVQQFPEVDAFIKIDDYPKLDLILQDLLQVDFKTCYGVKRKLITDHYYAYLKIAEGCNHRCAYCAIPLIRGPYHSIAAEKLVAEAQRLLSLGVKELNIIAQDTTYYGYDRKDKVKLKELLIELDHLPFKWIRLLYLYPEEIDLALLETIKSCKHVLPYFDIPLQSGSSKVLKLMNRSGDIAAIKAKIALIRRLFPDAFIRTTMIVAFPGESATDFAATLDLVESVKFDALGAFIYSKEENTPAYNYPDEVTEEVAEERYRQLMAKQYALVQSLNQKRIGKIYEVLIEKYDFLTRKYCARAYFSAPDEVDAEIYLETNAVLTIGEFYQVKITSFKDYDFFGELV